MKHCHLRLLILPLLLLPFMGYAMTAKEKLPSANKQKPAVSKTAPVYLSANEMHYDRDTATVIATGKVEAVQGEYILLADKVEYHQQTGEVDAAGHASLLQPDGSVVFGDSMKMSSDMSDGIIHQMRARMASNSLFAAREARKRGEKKYELRHGVFSPCKLCRDPKTGTTGAPLWQIKANRIDIDETEQDVVYHQAWMEVYGYPVIYTPYFEHPTPNADRKTGFLNPTYSDNSTLGFSLQLPYYFNISPDKDATLTPFYTTKLGPVLIGQYRQKTDKGYYQFDGSITDPTKIDDNGNEVDGNHELRGHIFTHGGSQLDPNWDWGFDVNRATDDTYLRVFKLGNQDSLTSRLYVERIENRNYVDIEALAFQNLVANVDSSTIPYVLPSARAHIESDPLFMGSRYHFDFSGDTINRSTGSESRRLTAETGYNLPYVLPDGQIVTAAADVRVDEYSTSDVMVNAFDTDSGSVTRGVPTLSLDWRYPMVRYMNGDSITLEPQVELVAASNGNNSTKIPNLDSLVPEFSDVNLFSTDRNPGYDRMENGERVIYGVDSEYHLKGGATFNGMLGQDIQLAGNRSFPVSDNLSEDVSDYVGRLGMQIPHYELEYRFRLNAKDYSLNQNEVHTGLNWDPFGLSVDYIQTINDPVLADTDEGVLNASYKLTKDWSMNAYGRRDFNDDQMISAGGGITYANECLKLVTRLDREYTRDRDVQPDTTFMVRLFLQNIK